MTRFIESAVDVCSVNGWNGTKCVMFRVIINTHTIGIFINDMQAAGVVD